MPNDQHFSVQSPSRVLFAEIADKWSMMILCVLADEPRRFNDIKRRLEGVSQKSLTQTLRRLERNGIVTRRVVETSPIAVEYAISALGRSLLAPFRELHRWTLQNMAEVEDARGRFDGKASAV